MSEIKDVKSIIDTLEQNQGEINAEIRELIREKIGDIVENAIQSFGEAKPEKIPPRTAEAESDGDTREPVSYLPRAPERHMPDTIAYPHEPIEENESLICEKIRQMRKLEQVFYNGYLRRESAEVSIVRQGEFMANEQDDFGRMAFCSMQRPIYGAMSTSQLRTFFTWRTDVRRGVYNRTDPPYVILCCYELMNKIGVLSAHDAFNRLVDIWANCREFCPSLNKYMPQWLKDFYAYNNFEEDFEQLSESFPIKEALPDSNIQALMSGDYSNALEYLSEYSDYKIKSSKFYKASEQSAKLINGALEKVLSALELRFAEYGIALGEIICGHEKKDPAWDPFMGAYVSRDRMDGFHACRISCTERYGFKHGRPCHMVFEHMPYTGFIGYVLKNVEVILRERTGYRKAAPANITAVTDDFKNREKLMKAADGIDFERVIFGTVNEWCDAHGIYPAEKRKKTNKEPSENSPFYTPILPRKVEINVSELARIREESDEIARKLIVDEISPEETEALAEQISDEEFSQIAQSFSEELTFVTTDNTEDEKPGADLSSLPVEWRKFASSLSQTSLEMLKAVFGNTAEEFCRKYGLLPEPVYECINASALEYIGDMLIENGEIIPDYVDEIRNLIDVMNI